MKLAPGVSSTDTSLAAYLVPAPVGFEFSELDGSISGATRVSCSNALAKMLLGCGSSVVEDRFEVNAGCGPRRSL